MPLFISCRRLYWLSIFHNSRIAKCYTVLCFLSFRFRLLQKFDWTETGGAYFSRLYWKVSLCVFSIRGTENADRLSSMGLWLKICLRRSCFFIVIQLQLYNNKILLALCYVSSINSLFLLSFLISIALSFLILFYSTNQGFDIAVLVIDEAEETNILKWTLILLAKNQLMDL